MSWAKVGEDGGGRCQAQASRLLPQICNRQTGSRLGLGVPADCLRRSPGRCVFGFVFCRNPVLKILARYFDQSSTYYTFCGVIDSQESDPHQQESARRCDVVVLTHRPISGCARLRQSGEIEAVTPSWVRRKPSFSLILPSGASSALSDDLQSVHRTQCHTFNSILFQQL